jgi:putative transcriptional regulator
MEIQKYPGPRPASILHKPYKLEALEDELDACWGPLLEMYWFGPSRVFTVEGPDVKSIRCKLGVTQSDFATMLGISVRTLENWGQRRRTPRGPARVLLQIAEEHPEIVWGVVKQKKRNTKRVLVCGQFCDSVFINDPMTPHGIESDYL